MKPKKAMMERIATITPIATRNAPFTISPMMPQRMPNTPKAVRIIKPHIANPMYCATCLKFVVAVIAVSFVKFHDAVNPAIKATAECGLVGSFVFRPMPVLLHNESSEYVGEVKHPTSQGYCALGIGVAVLIFCFFMRIQELRELSFKLSYLPLVYPTFFYVSFCRIGRFHFGCLKR